MRGTAWLLGCALAAGCVPAPTRTAHPAPAVTPAATPLGDGSTSVTGPQPRRWPATRLVPGERPPQFVVLAWDGAETADGAFARLRRSARAHGASMTFFLSGRSLLPARDHRARGGRVAAQPTDRQIRDTVLNLTLGWREGHEVAARLDGPRCGRSGVRAWTAADWKSEIRRSIGLVTTWRTATGFTDLPALPFDYRKQVVGGRVPCREGTRALRKAAHDLGWKYDPNGTGPQVWPRRRDGLWRLPSKSLRRGKPAAVYQRAFDRAYRGDRAPLVISGRFTHGKGGRLNAVEGFLARNAARPDVRFVSFRQLVEWLEAQDPAVLARLRALPVGERPARGWTRHLWGAGKRDDRA
ncbi:hypothetical protein LO762_20215 [Actinocorallia sp. API 0066]|uniref:hypothetical protein n=1 Tax=Actinocorallia sp. API 0066 TaxID=2896846 RepID=UPI001E3490A0|nr:hypothetical protein [Actinocorallia sp. API 0066]MCD0451502.1 hypothetical protein [Actinocorallia sp. API 0066]